MATSENSSSNSRWCEIPAAIADEVQKASQQLKLPFLFHPVHSLLAERKQRRGDIYSGVINQLPARQTSDRQRCAVGENSEDRRVGEERVQDCVLVGSDRCASRRRHGLKKNLKDHTRSLRHPNKTCCKLSHDQPYIVKPA